MFRTPRGSKLGLRLRLRNLLEEMETKIEHLEVVPVAILRVGDAVEGGLGGVHCRVRRLCAGCIRLQRHRHAVTDASCMQTDSSKTPTVVKTTGQTMTETIVEQGITCPADRVPQTTLALGDGGMRQHLQQGEGAVHGLPRCLGAAVHIDGAAGIVAQGQPSEQARDRNVTEACAQNARFLIMRLAGVAVANRHILAERDLGRNVRCIDRLQRKESNCHVYASDLTSASTRSTASSAR